VNQAVELPPAQVGELLAAALERHFGPVTLSGLERLSGGASRETWSFDVDTPAGTRHRLILRRDPGATGRAGPEGWRGGKTAYSLDRDTEAQLQRAVFEAGGPVARVHFSLPADHPLGSCYVMDRIEGEVLAPRILRDEAFAGARARMARQCGAILAGLHAIDTAKLPAGLSRMPPRALLGYYRELLDGLSAFYRDETPVGRPEYHPAFELAFRWLEERCPDRAPSGLVHGDFRNGNFVVGPEGIRAVLDWELGHLGDGMEDLGWLCVRAWRFGQHRNPVGGFGSREDLFAGYEDAGGRAVDPRAVHFWEVFGTLKWGIVCQFQAYKHISGLIDSFEHLAIGRRACENEFDLLQLIEEP
jgi:aminoglycoside phosphotransferase (APT) family kinase protein